MKKNRFFKLVFVLAVSFFYAFTLSAQIRITGTVNDDTGSTLPGVNVTVKGTSIGSVTDVNGMYSVNVPNENAVLVFSFVGFATQEIAVGNQQMINVALVEGTSLEEVVVVGYGTMKRSDVTSAIASVGPRDFIKQQALRPTDALQGRVAGVQVTNTGGDPFSPTKIRIRGTNSINRGNDPLYVVNGVVGGGMPAVEDIESIEVLKDASATALYGSRGANGVILVTTKKGVAGKTTITYDGYGTLFTPGRLYDKLDAAAFCEAYNYMTNSNHFSNAAIADWRETGGPDWQETVLQNAWQQRHRLNMSGGNEKVRFYTTVDYTNREAMIRDRTSESIGFSNRLDVDLFDNIKLEWTASASRGKNRNNNNQLRGGSGSLLFNAIINAPIVKLINDDGSYVALPPYGPNENNFLAELNEDNRWNQSINARSNMALTWENIVPGLTATYRLNAAYGSGQSHEFLTTKYLLGNPPRGGGGSSENVSYFQNIVLNYNKNFGQHGIGLTGVVESYQYQDESSSYSGRTFGTDILGYWGLGLAEDRTVDVGYSNEALLSYVGRLNYNYAEKYILTATIRRDGSSKFVDKNKWSTFPSASVAWRISEEDFLKNTGIFYDLKLRASYGVTGSQAVSSYQTVAQLQSTDVSFEDPVNVPSFRPRVINPDLKWESTAQWDIGLDFGLLNNRLNGSFDYYNKNTTDLLMEEPLPGYLGGENVWRNKGEMNNKGVELALRYIAINNNDLTLEFSGNIARNTNKIVSLGQEAPIYTNGSIGNSGGMDMDQINVLMGGYRMGSIFGYQTDGLWKDSEAAEAAKFGAAPGDIKIRDIGGVANESDGRIYRWYEDGFAPDGKIDTNDRTIIGCGTPDLTWGFNASATYKNWDANLMLQGVVGADMLNVVYAAASTARQGRSSTITLAEAWVNSYAPGVENPTFPNPQSQYSMNRAINTSFWVQNASFMRIKNLSVGYTFGRDILKYASLRLYISTQNLYTLTKYKGLDPESSSTMESDNGTGIDNGANPNPRCFTFGAQLIF